MTRILHTTLRLLGVLMAFAVLFAAGSPGLVRAATGELGSTGQPGGSEYAVEGVDTDAGSCGLDELDEDDRMVACGAEFLANFADSGRLRNKMSARTCSVLLDRLFDDQVCAFGDPDCGQLLPGLPVPAAPKLLGGGASFVLVMGPHPLDGAGRSGLLRSENERVPVTELRAPPTPPPNRSV